MKRKTKDTISNIAGIAFAIGTALTGLGASGLEIPKQLLTVGIVMVAISGAVIGYMTGKKTTP